MLTVFQNIVGPECLYIYVSNLTLYTLAVRYPLSNYEGIWISHIESLPLRISDTWHSIMREAASLPPPRKDT